MQTLTGHAGPSSEERRYAASLFCLVSRKCVLVSPSRRPSRFSRETPVHPGRAQTSQRRDGRRLHFPGFSVAPYCLLPLLCRFSILASVLFVTPNRDLRFCTFALCAFQFSSWSAFRNRFISGRSLPILSFQKKIPQSLGSR